MSRNVFGNNQRLGALESILKWGLIGVIFLVPLIYFPHKLLLFTAPKTFFFIGCVNILACVWIWLMVQDKRYRPTWRNSWSLAAIGLFLVTLTISALAGVDTFRSFFSGIERGTGLIFLYHCFLFALMLSIVVRIQGRDFIKRILQSNAAASVVMAVATFFTADAFSVGSRVLDNSSNGAFLGNTSYTGAYFVFSVFLILVLIAVEKSKKMRMWYGLGLLPILFSPIFFNVGILKGTASLSSIVSSPYLLIGQARMAALSVGVGLVLALFVWLTAKGKHALVRIIGALGIIGMLIGTGVVAYQIAQPESTLQKAFVQQAASGRLFFWAVAEKGIQERPILGWGPENYHVVYQKYFDSDIMRSDNTSEIFTDRPHNSFIEVLINGGIVGFISYILAVLVLIVCLYRLYRQEKISGAALGLLYGLLFAYLLQNQLFFDVSVTYILFFVLIGVVTGMTQASDTSDVHDVKPLPAIVPIIATIGLLFVWIYCSYLPSRIMTKAHAVADTSLGNRLAMYNSILETPGSYILEHDFGYIVGIGSYSYNPDRQIIKQDQARRESTIQEVRTILGSIDKVWRDDTLDYRLAVNAARMSALEMYLSDEPTPEKVFACERYAKRAMELSQNDPSVYLSYAECLIYGGRIEEARQVIDNALGINPRFALVQRYKLRLEKLFGTPQSYRLAYESAIQYIPEEYLK